MATLRSVLTLIGCLGVGGAGLGPPLTRIGADRWWGPVDAASPQRALAAGLIEAIDRDFTAEVTTGSELFDAEWVFGTYLMTGIGVAQIALAARARGVADPGVQATYREAGERSIAVLLSPEVRRFSTIQAGGDDPIEGLDVDASVEGEPGRRADHAAYLGYLSVLMGLQRRLYPETEHAATHDRIIDVLAARLRARPQRLLHTYPGEVYPMDNAAVFAGLRLHTRATGVEHPIVDEALEIYRKRYMQDGLLFYAVEEDGAGVELRGSATAFAAYMMSFVDRDLSAELHRGIQRRLRRRALGYAWVREHPAEAGYERMTIDSGPIVFGAGTSATGFALAAFRLHGAESDFVGTLGLVQLFGAPLERGGRLGFVTGGPIGNAILLAMMTADPVVSFPGGRSQ